MIEVPVAEATAIYQGEDTGVEISFHIMITDPEVRVGTLSQGHLVRWMSVEPHPNYVRTQEMVALAPGDKLVRDIGWDGRLGGGRVLLSGDYVLFGQFYHTLNGLDSKDFDVIMGQKPFKVVSE